MTSTEKILELHSSNQNLSQKQISVILGISRERVRQIFNSLGLANDYRTKRAEERVNLIRPLFMKNLPRTEISRMTGMSRDMISRIVNSDYEMKSTIFIYNKPYSIDKIKTISEDWKTGMTVMELCHKHELCDDSFADSKKSAIVSHLRTTFGDEMFPKRNCEGVDDLIERYNELKTAGKTLKEIFEIVGGYKNESCMRVVLARKTKEQNDN